MSELIIVQDESSIANTNEASIFLWEGYTENENIKSLLKYVDTNCDRLRAKYLDFVDALGNKAVYGISVAETLAIDNEFSLWWMSLLTEKSPYKSPRILDCIRLFALEEIITEKKISSLFVTLKDPKARASIKYLCDRNQITYIDQPPPKESERLSIRKIYDRLPHIIQGFIYALRYITTRWKFRNNTLPKWHAGNDTVFFMSNFFHLDIKKTTQGYFYSRQWEILPDFLTANGLKTNFLHHFLYSPEVPTTQKAFSLIERFNKQSIQASHLILDTFLDFSVLICVFKDWLKFLFSTKNIIRDRTLFNPQNSNISLWFFLESDWKSSLTGSNLVLNLFSTYLFKRAMTAMPPQQTGLYLCENQGWESAFIHFWKKNGHGKLVGVAHATVRFWDIRYFHSKYSFERKAPYSRPRADKLAINGKMGWHLLTKSGYPENALIDVEALRFLYLLDLDKRAPNYATEESANSILVIGDFEPKRTKKMLELINEANKSLTSKFEVTLKPHPACRLDLLRDYSFKLTNEPVGKIAQRFKHVFSSNTTSASLDAYLAGSSVVVFLDPNDFNFSPLKGIEDVLFVSDIKYFIERIEKKHEYFSASKVEDFFWLDSNLPKWRMHLRDLGLRSIHYEA